MGGELGYRGNFCNIALTACNIPTFSRPKELNSSVAHERSEGATERVNSEGRGKAGVGRPGPKGRSLPLESYLSTGRAKRTSRVAHKHLQSCIARASEASERAQHRQIAHCQ